MSTITGPNASGVFTVLASHTYANGAGGVYTIATTVTHDTIATVTDSTALVMGASIQKGVLTIVGSQSGANCSIDETNGMISVTTNFIGTRHFAAAGVTSIETLLLGGNDNLTLRRNVSQPVLATFGTGTNSCSDNGTGNFIAVGGNATTGSKAGAASTC